MRMPPALSQAYRHLRGVLAPAMFCAALAVSLFCFSVSEAYAAGAACATQKLTVTCDDLQPVTTSSNGTFTPSIVTKAMVCIRQAVSSATTQLQCAFADYLHNAILLACALTLTLYGMKLMTGHIQQIMAESAVILLRVGVVLLLTFNFDRFYPAFFGAIDEFIGFLNLTLGSDSCSVTGNGPLLNATGQQVVYTIGTFTQNVTAQDVAVWLQLDCIFDRLFSFNTVGNTALKGMVTYIASILFLNTLGLMIFIAALSAAISFLLMTVRAILLVLLSYLSIGFLTIISPMIIPCILTKQTMSYFLKWSGLMINAIIQPIFIIAFMSFSVIVLVSLAYDGTYTDDKGAVHQMWGDPNDPTAIQPLSKSIPPLSDIHWTEKSFNMMNIMGDQNVYNKLLRGMGLLTDDQGIGIDIKNGQKEVGFIRGMLNPDPNAKQTLIPGSAVPISGSDKSEGIDMDVAFKVRVPDIDDTHLRMMILTLVTMLVLAILISKLLWEIPSIANQITGTAGLTLFRGATRLAIGKYDLERGAQNAVASIDRNTRARLAGAQGGGALREGVGGMIAGAGSGAKAGYARGGILGGIGGIFTGGTGGGMAGVRTGLMNAAKSQMSTGLGGAMRTIPEALKGLYQGTEGSE